ncbi:putative F-box/LRR-repeat protein 23 [Cicer arietinum]|uniref:F-box/LRR-repeat protein 23 n=1 Tax=Cicer arietinum TaxID=3827 RepID=A0A1S2Z873_CICAR|nr:putative F-box/LRR-repeat protein 23 [Cicer arietinum]
MLCSCIMLSRSTKTTETKLSDLPRDAIASILHKLSGSMILTSARYVCSLWWNICKDPRMWHSIDIDTKHFSFARFDFVALEKICRYSVDKSLGYLTRINIEYFGTDILLQYIAVRAGQLRSIRLYKCEEISDKGLREFVMKFPQLEELDIAFTNISKESLEVIAKSCPLLKTLKYRSLVGEDIEENDEALIITHNMHELRHLETYGTMITNYGIIAILNGCPLLQYLDLRSGFHLDMSRGKFYGLAMRCYDWKES